MNLKDFDSLVQFFGSNFHQDWDQEEADFKAVIQRFITENPPDEVLLVHQKLKQLLGLSVSDEELHHILFREFLCYYEPGFGIATRHWLMQVLALLQRNT
jgi:hypothetical protein